MAGPSVSSSAPAETTMAPGSPYTEPQGMPSFFKVMVGDFKKRMKIPTEFIMQINRKPPSNTILWGANGRSWQVEVQESEDEFFFQKGWSDFVKDNALEIGDFVVFECDDDLNFDVIVLGHDQCEKEVTEKRRSQSKAPKQKPRTKATSVPSLCNCKYVPGGEAGGEPVFDAESCPYNLTNPHFVIVIKVGVNTARVRVPKVWGKETGIWPGFGDETCIVDPDGRSWPVNLSLSDRRSNRGSFAGGWGEVVKEHKLVGGEVCIFEVVRKGNCETPSLISLHIRRKGQRG